MPTTTPKITAAALAECFRAAKAAAEAIDNPEDGGTCNRDCPAFRIERCRESLIKEAAALAGVTASDFDWFGGRRWWWLTGFLEGQGNKRARMSHAATRALEAAAAVHCPQMKVCEYCQMD